MPCSSGVPRGRISEFLGPHSSGKTSLLLFLAATTRRGEVAAWVDLADALHPESHRQRGRIFIACCGFGRQR